MERKRLNFIIKFYCIIFIKKIQSVMKWLHSFEGRSLKMKIFPLTSMQSQILIYVYFPHPDGAQVSEKIFFLINVLIREGSDVISSFRFINVLFASLSRLSEISLKVVAGVN